MSLALIGGLVGLAFGVVEYFFFGALIARADRRGEKAPGPRLLDLARKTQLILFPLIGFMVGSILAGDNGVQ
jgi:hypothetical protein